jgi:hypothetical protein
LVKPTGPINYEKEIFSLLNIVKGDVERDDDLLLEKKDMYGNTLKMKMLLSTNRVELSLENEKLNKPLYEINLENVDLIFAKFESIPHLNIYLKEDTKVFRIYCGDILYLQTIDLRNVYN